MENQKFIDKAVSLKPLFAELVDSVKDFDNGNLVPFFYAMGHRISSRR